MKVRLRAKRTFAQTSVLLIIILLVGYLGVSALVASILATPRRVASDTSPARYGLAFSDVAFPARGGDVQLSAWYLPHAPLGRAVVLVHGKDASRQIWLNNGYAPLIVALQQRGFAVLMLDLRGHGRSGDAHFSFGLNERRDVEGAVDWLQANGIAAGRIGVLGVSMGAASSTLAAAEEPAIGALVADSGYAAILPIIRQEWGSASHLPGFFLPSTLLMARMMYGYDLGTARPVDVIGTIAPRPVLIIHGTADTLIPIANADALQAADPAAELWKVEGATHGQSITVAGAAYVQRVAAFFDMHVR